MGFYVAVYYASIVGVLQSSSYLYRDLDSAFPRNVTSVLQVSVQCVGDELHHDVGLVLVEPQSVDRGDVRVVHLRQEAGLAVEPMASPAACRTYNVLLSEGRRVAVALLPVA